MIKKKISKKRVSSRAKGSPRKKEAFMDIKKLGKNKAQESSAENIFDSRVGKTDALFVSSPEALSANVVIEKMPETQSNPLANSDPKDLIMSQDGKNMIKPDYLPGLNGVNGRFQPKTGEEKLSWWKKILNLFDSN